MLHVQPPQAHLERRTPSQDRRLGTAQQLLLDHPQIIFDDPVRAAAVWGIHLATEFFVCEIPSFSEDMTLEEYERRSMIQSMSPAMSEFLNMVPGESGSQERYGSQAAISWLGEVCPIGCVRRCSTTVVPPQHVRRWTHKKLYSRDDKMFQVRILILV